MNFYFRFLLSILIVSLMKVVLLLEDPSKWATPIFTGWMAEPWQLLFQLLIAWNFWTCASNYTWRYFQEGHFKQGDCILDIVVHLFCHNVCNFLWNQSCPIIKMEYLHFFILAFIAVESPLWSRHCWHTLFHRNKKNPVIEFFSFSRSHIFGCFFLSSRIVQVVFCRDIICFQ